MHSKLVHIQTKNQVMSAVDMMVKCIQSTNRWLEGKTPICWRNQENWRM